jgi:DHA2 family multidrug resistance protein-like MFS transporter
MFNLFPTSGTHASLILAGVFATLAAAVSGLRITQSTAQTAQPSREVK